MLWKEERAAHKKILRTYSQEVGELTYFTEVAVFCYCVSLIDFLVDTDSEC